VHWLDGASPSAAEAQAIAAASQFLTTSDPSIVPA
jgi:hypothetical protein